MSFCIVVGLAEDGDWRNVRKTFEHYSWLIDKIFGEIRPEYYRKVH